MKKTVKAWAVLNKRGRILWTFLMKKDAAMEADVAGNLGVSLRVVPITIAYDDGRKK